MKRIIVSLLFAFSICATAQTTPLPATVMVSSNGLPPFAPLTSASGLFQINYTPTLSFVPMCSATGLPPFSQCTFSGGGAGSTAGVGGGGGGGAGGYVYAVISNPALTYTYTVGAAGAGGTLGTSGAAGGNGAAGLIKITAHFQ